ncbi:MAG TPA: hypothetical protein VF527_18800, partial [Pyrinomonadaceae bacterium]
EFTILPVEAVDANTLLAGSGKDKVRIKLGGVLESTAESYRNLLASGSSGERRGESLFPKVILDVPKDLDGEFNLMLLTTINVFDSIALRAYESGLTCPKILYDPGKIRGGTSIELEYHLGDSPEFTYRSL